MVVYICEHTKTFELYASDRCSVCAVSYSPGKLFYSFLYFEDSVPTEFSQQMFLRASNVRTGSQAKTQPWRPGAGRLTYPTASSLAWPSTAEPAADRRPQGAGPARSRQAPAPAPAPRVGVCGLRVCTTRAVMEISHDI